MRERCRIAAKNRVNRKENDQKTKKQDLSEPSNPSAARIQFLQRTIGNKTVERFIRSMSLQAKLKKGMLRDEYEDEADRVAEQVARMPEEEELKHRPMKEEEEKLQAKGDPVFNPDTNQGIENQIRSMKGGGLPLSEGERAFFEPRFGHDLSQVRVHTDYNAAKTAQAVNAQAYTIGRDVVFGEGQYPPRSYSGQKLLAHELTHTIQQRSMDERIQRYEAGEHARIGETGEELKTAFAPISYTVQKSDSLNAIARKFGVTVQELKDANKTRLKKWPARDGSGRMIEGFNAGVKVSIPQKLNDFAKAAIEDKSAKFTVKGVVLDYGIGIAMGDLYESPEQLAGASPEELKELAVLIKREQSGGKPVTTEEWEKATRGRYLKLAEKNEAHFGPPNPVFLTPSTAGAASSNHKTEWEKYHKSALDASKSGDKDRALMINAYGDHFLTDAFSSGHLLNKRDIMEQFKSQLKLDVKGEEFIKESKVFFDDVAKNSFTGGVMTEFSKYETYDAYAMGWHPNIDSVSRFSALLQGIHKQEPDLLANAVAKGVHDTLNIIPGGIPVENAVGDRWNLSGDGTLNARTEEIARKAVSLSQINVISVYKVTTTTDYHAMFKKVWDFTPKPSASGAPLVIGVVQTGTDVQNVELKNAVIKLIKDNYRLIIDELVKRKKLRRA